MATEVVLHKICTQCNGTGQFSPATGPGAGGAITCTWPGCNGTGYLVLGKIELDPGLDDILDRVNDVLDKCNDILAEVQGE